MRNLCLKNRRSIATFAGVCLCVLPHTIMLQEKIGYLAEGLSHISNAISQQHQQKPQKKRRKKKMSLKDRVHNAIVGQEETTWDSVKSKISKLENNTIFTSLRTAVQKCKKDIVHDILQLDIFRITGDTEKTDELDMREKTADILHLALDNQCPFVLEELATYLPTEKPFVIQNQKGETVWDRIPDKTAHKLAGTLPDKILAGLRNPMSDTNQTTFEPQKNVIIMLARRMHRHGFDFTSGSNDHVATDPWFIINTAAERFWPPDVVNALVYYSPELLTHLANIPTADDLREEHNIETQSKVGRKEGDIRFDAINTARESAKILYSIRYPDESKINVAQLPSEKLSTTSWAGRSPLQEAVKYGNVELVKKIFRQKVDKPKTQLTSPTKLEKDGACMLLTAAEGIAQAKDANSEQNIKQSLAHVVHKARQQGAPFNVEGPDIHQPWIPLPPNCNDDAEKKDRVRAANTYILSYRIALTLYGLHTTPHTHYTSQADVVKAIIDVFPSDALKPSARKQLAKILEGKSIKIHPQRQAESIWQHLVHAYFESEEPFDITAILKTFGKENFTQQAKDDVEDAFGHNKDQNTYEQRTTELQQAFKDIFDVTITPDE